MRQLRILIVEDEMLSRELLMMALADFGSFGVATRGTEAIEAIRLSYESGAPYDLVFLDIILPEMDGLTALKAIRAYEASREPAGSGPCKVIILTAVTDSRSEKEAFECKCDGYITKPYSKAMLVEAIMKTGLLVESGDR